MTTSLRERNEIIWDMRSNGAEFEEIGERFGLSKFVTRDIYYRIREEKSKVGSYLASDLCIGEHVWLHGTVADHLLDPEGEPPPGVEFVIEDIEYDLPKRLLKYHCRSVKGGYREMFTNRDMPGLLAGDGYECGTDAHRGNAQRPGRGFGISWS